MAVRKAGGSITYLGGTHSVVYASILVDFNGSIHLQGGKIKA